MMMSEQKPIFRTQDVPKKPGVYVYRDSSGQVIYVGKARNLRSRMSSYFRQSALRDADPKRRALILKIASYEIFTVETENEALLLETQFIKTYAPKYNILMRDDKRFLHVKIDLAELYPRLQLERLKRDDGCIYIGPFPQSYALRETVEFINKHYNLRTCETPEPNEETHRHCLEHVIRECPCPCLGKITPEEYRKRIDLVLELFKGNGAPALLAELYEKMKSLSEAMDFEQAAQLRDIIANLKSVLEPARRFRNQTIITRHAVANEEGMEALREALGLSKNPEVMECFDMANISGTLAVGSMVSFHNGKPNSSGYRRFKIRSETASDDTAFMREVLTRRYGRLLRENLPMPDLIVLDGGITQVNTGKEVFASLGMDTPFIGLAKKEETIVRPDGTEILLPRENPGLKLLQAIRDEAHRWANGYHRLLRNKRISDSILDNIPGIGKTRKVTLLKAFGSARELARKSAEEIARAVPGIGPEMAEKIHDYLAPRFNE